MRMASRGTPPWAFPRETSTENGIHLLEVSQTELELFEVAETPVNAREAKDNKDKALTSVGAICAESERKEVGGVLQSEYRLGKEEEKGRRRRGLSYIVLCHEWGWDEIKGQGDGPKLITWEASASRLKAPEDHSGHDAALTQRS